jgi:very-short-patch-repair endonuclease
VASRSGAGVGESMQDNLMLSRATRLRNESTPFEIQLWRHLKGSCLDGHKFRRQYVIDSAIVDFFCPAKGLIVEVDGATHDGERDAARDRRHAQLGFHTVRVTNADVGKNMQGVLQLIADKLRSLPDRWPHPAASRPPSPEGEGN